MSIIENHCKQQLDAGKLALGFGDEAISRPHYLVHSGDAWRSIRKGGNCLSSPNGKYPCHASQSGSCQNALA